MAKTYKISEVCGDWALHIPPYGKMDEEMILIFNSRSNAELVKSVLEWEDAHPNAAVPYMPTLTPPNEWVSVDDELPETAGEYLVVYHPCHWDNVSAKICVGIDSFRGKTAWAKKKYQRVTHWMPLPAPPAKVDES